MSLDIKFLLYDLRQLSCSNYLAPPMTQQHQRHMPIEGLVWDVLRSFSQNKQIRSSVYRRLGELTGAPGAYVHLFWDIFPVSV